MEKPFTDDPSSAKEGLTKVLSVRRCLVNLYGNKAQTKERAEEKQLRSNQLLLRTFLKA